MKRYKFVFRRDLYFELDFEHSNCVICRFLCLILTFAHLFTILNYCNNNIMIMSTNLQ